MNVSVLWWSVGREAVRCTPQYTHTHKHIDEHQEKITLDITCEVYTTNACVCVCVFVVGSLVFWIANYSTAP